MSPKATFAAYLRNFVFGVEDSLVSTVGLLSGIAIAGQSREDIFVTGIVLIFVEAISMSAGSFLSESSAEEYETQKESTSKRTYVGALVMFVSYFVSGFIPLVPYVLLPVSSAFPVSIIVSIFALGVLGFVGARLAKTKFLPSVMRMMGIGGAAILVGALVGTLIG